MPLVVFNNEPLSAATTVGENDYFTGDGTTEDFVLSNKPFTSVANPVQVTGGTLFRHLGSVTGSGFNINLSPAPGIGAKIIVPHVTRMLLKAYDVDPLSNRTFEAAFHLGDIVDIISTQYEKTIGQTGIKLQIVDKDTGFGVDTTFIQIAPAQADGTVGTYLSAGSPLFLNYDLTGFTTVNANELALSQSLTVADGTEIPNTGVWIVINPGQPTQDIVWVTSVTGNVLTLREQLSFNHSVGENVFVCATMFYLKLTVPLNFTGGSPTNLFDDALDVTYDAVFRD